MSRVTSVTSVTCHKVTSVAHATSVSHVTSVAHVTSVTRSRVARVTRYLGEGGEHGRHQRGHQTLGVAGAEQGERAACYMSRVTLQSTQHYMCHVLQSSQRYSCHASRYLVTSWVLVTTTGLDTVTTCKITLTSFLNKNHPGRTILSISFLHQIHALSFRLELRWISDHEN